MYSLQSIIPRCLAVIVVVLLAACETLLPPKPPVPPAPAPVPPVAIPVPPPAPPSIPAPTVDIPAIKPPAPASALRATTWDAIPSWREDSPQLAWGAFMASCGTLKNQGAWQSVCSMAAGMSEPSRETAFRFFENNFTPYQVINTDGSDSGLVTGYYEPLLNGSRKRSARYHVPVYGVPDDLLVIDLGEVYPELRNMRLRGRIDGKRVIPYFNRAQIETGAARVAGKELAWVEDSVELFFMQIQGSGRVKLDGRDTIALGYADQNGYPYRSIGRLLVDRGDLPLEKASMQGIKSWAKQNPERLQELLNYNASYVFFREMPRDLPGPVGALGVPLTARRSIAVDARYVPLGAPVFLATTMPNARQPLNRLMVAQDTGGAIRGPVRADFFWGFGEEAATLAGRMRQSGRMWVLLPNGFPVPAAN